MTPYLPATAATIPAPPKPSKEVSTSRETESKTVSTNKDEDVSKDASGFETLMAGLLNTPPLTQTQPVVKQVANDTVTASVTPSSTATPPLVVVPQDTPASSLAAPTTSGDFSQELLSALTPGTPTIPASDVPADLPPVAVPVLAQKPDVPPSPELTVDPQSTVTAEPRVIASGLSPNQMQGVKDQVTTQAPQATQSANTNTPPVMTVAITPDKNAPVVNAAPAADATSNVVAAVIVTPAKQTITPSVSKPAAVVPVETATVDIAAVDTVIAVAADIPADDSFDPVEFRIAQGFQRPTSSSSSNTQVQPQSTPASGYQGNADVAQTTNAVTKGKIDLPPLSSSSPTISTTVATDLSTPDLLSATPVATPVIANPLTSPIVQSNSATQSLPAVHTVAAIINKAAKEGGPQTISLRLDPPELGKLEVHMKYSKGDPLKVHLVVEKADTATLFQKDAHVLETALKDAGIQTDGSSLSFEFSQNNSSFNQAMGQDSSSKGQNQAWSPTATSETPALETSMDVYTDARTGLTHYNIRA